MIDRRRTLRTAFAAALLALHPAAATADALADARAVVGVMRATWDRPEAPLAVAPAVVRGEHALAGWIQGEMGGVALVQRRHGAWVVLLCANSSLADAAALVAAEVPGSVATRLAIGWAEAVRTVSADALARFQRFEGVVRMDEAGHHPPAHGRAPGH